MNRTMMMAASIAAGVVVESGGWVVRQAGEDLLADANEPLPLGRADGLTPDGPPTLSE